MDGAARRDRSRIYVTRTADHRVIGLEHGAEEVLVDIVEPGATLTDPALGDKGTGEQCEPPLVVRQRLTPLARPPGRPKPLPRDLTPLACAKAQVWVGAGMEDLCRRDRLAEPVQRLEVDLVVRLGLRI